MTGRWWSETNGNGGRVFESKVPIVL